MHIHKIAGKVTIVRGLSVAKLVLFYIIRLVELIDITGQSRCSWLSPDRRNWFLHLIGQTYYCIL